MANYTANNPVKTLTVHKPECRFIPRSKLRPCGCGDTGKRGNQRWYCEDHISSYDVDRFMNGKFWAVLLCDGCFRI